MVRSGISDDAIIRFEAANPAPEAIVRELAGSPGALALERAVRNLPRRARPWWRRFVIPTVIVVVLGGAWTFYQVFARPVTNPQVVLCYRAPSADASAVYATGPLGTAVASCAELWKVGRLGPPGAPPLEECVLADGVAAVFPTSNANFCARLKLAQTSGTPNPAINELDEQLLHAVQSSRCLTPSALSLTAQHLINSLGLRGWHVVRDTGFDVARPCAGEILEPTTRTVYLVPEGAR